MYTYSEKCSLFLIKYLDWRETLPSLRGHLQVLFSVAINNILTSLNNPTEQ